MKKILISFFIMLFPFAQAQDKLSGSVSRDDTGGFYEILDTNFIDLNYSIEFKPLNLLSNKEIKIKKEKTGQISGYKAPPSSYEISLSTGRASGKTDIAQNMEALLKTNPNNKDLILACAIQLKNENRLDYALQIANRALEIDPDFALAHFLRGDILRRMEKFKEAAMEYVYTAQINPYCADAYFNIAKILELLDDRELALDYYKTAYQINPNDEEIKNIILDSYIDL